MKLTPHAPVIEDFFRLQGDVLLYFPLKLVSSNIMGAILDAAAASLTLAKEAPLIPALHFLRDFLMYGGPNMPSSNYDSPSQATPANLQAAVKHLISGRGEVITQRVLAGMMYTFPGDCFPDASGVLLELFRLVPEAALQWLKTTITMLPEGSMTQQESQRLVTGIEQYVELFV